MTWSKMWKAGLGILAVMSILSTVSPAVVLADVARIREKALELEQKLNKNRFESTVRAEKPSSHRVYKDFDFLLKESKVSEVAEATQDPDAAALRMYLIRSIVESQLASYVDDLKDFQQTSTADLEGEPMVFPALLTRLSRAADGGARRKIVNVITPLVETSAVFRNQIVTKRNELYKEWGFENYADFYSQKEGLDLDALDAEAKRLITQSQPVYDALFAEMAMSVLGVEARKVRFYDLPFLTYGCQYGEAFPASSGTRRLRGVFKGLGVDLSAQTNLSIDLQEEEGTMAVSACIPVLVPDQIEVSIRVAGCDLDNARLAYAVGESQLFTQSTQPTFERSYLVNQTAQSALAWIPRMVLDEGAWIRENMEGDLDPEAYIRYRAFVSLHEARFLAALTQLEIAVYREQTVDPTKEFRGLIKTATGARVSSSDAQRATEFLSQLSAASRFQGLLIAAGARKHLSSEFGETWFKDGNAASLLNPLWSQGGALTPEAVTAACGLDGVQADIYLDSISALME